MRLKSRNSVFLCKADKYEIMTFYIDELDDKATL